MGASGMDILVADMGNFQKHASNIGRTKSKEIKKEMKKISTPLKQTAGRY